MTDTQDPLWRALARIEHAELREDDRNLLRPAFAAMHGSHAMRLPATVVARMVSGNTVVDHEHVVGLADGVVEAIAVYRVDGDRITTVWFY